MRISFIFLFMALLLVQCKKEKHVAQSAGNGASKGSITKVELPRIKVQADGGANEASDNFTLNDARIVGDTLIVDVSFGGGCKEHDFELYSNGMWMKSLPPKMAIRLVHRAHEDNCRAYLTQTRKFLLTDARYNGQKQVVILLDAGGEPRSISYNY